MAPKRLRAKREKPQSPRKKASPRYCGPHKTGQAYSVWPIGTAEAGRMRYHGKYGTPESRENYRRWLAEMGTDTEGLAGSGDRPLLTIAEWWEQWLDWTDQRGRYHKAGEETSGLGNYRSAMSWLLPLYGSMLATDFEPYHLDIVREDMAEAGLARNTINAYVGKIKRIWRRAAAKGIVDREHYLALEAVEPYQIQEGGRETERVLSVPEEAVQAVLEVVTPPVRAMIEICCWSGCRTQEARLMRTCDIKDEDPIIPPQLQGRCWVYRPPRHKTEHHGINRLILLGPQAQAIIEPWLRPTERERYLFSPYESKSHLIRKRMTKHGRRVGKSPQRNTLPTDRAYSPSCLWDAITDACEKLGIPHWHPHQLRHLAATRLAKAYGIEITQILLGHADIKTTLKYVDPGVITADDRKRYAAAIKAIAEHG
jgi:integrase